MTENAQETSFKTIAAVLVYLKNNGWLISKSALYRHWDEGKFLPHYADGEYRQGDIDKYAMAWLKRRDTGRYDPRGTVALQQRKLELKIKIMAIDCKQKEFRLEKSQGKYILREQADIELLRQAGIFEATLRSLIQSHAADLIRMTGGNQEKAGALVNLMQRQLAEHIKKCVRPL